MKKHNSKYYPNMDVVRYILAIGIIVHHFCMLIYNDSYLFLSFYGVGGFFAMSGFLAYPAFEKAAGLKDYVVKRAYRILPPYVFIVLLSAAGLVMVSDLPAKEYFLDSGFWEYLAANLAFLNWLHPDLPGVFGGGEYLTSAVNGSLWTMKVEWCLFLTVPVVFRLARRCHIRNGIMCVIVIVLSTIYKMLLILWYEQTGSALLEILSRQFFGQLTYYYVGMLIYFYREKFARHLPAFLILSVIGGLCVMWIPYGLYTVAPIVTGTSVLAVSLMKFAPIVLNHKHNVSYGMYLFHYPVIQGLIFIGMRDWPVYWGFAAALAITIGLALFCHFLIEVPVGNRYVKSK